MLTLGLYVGVVLVCVGCRFVVFYFVVGVMLLVCLLVGLRCWFVVCMGCLVVWVMVWFGLVGLVFGGAYGFRLGLGLWFDIWL